MLRVFIYKIIRLQYRNPIFLNRSTHNIWYN